MNAEKDNFAGARLLSRQNQCGARERGGIDHWQKTEVKREYKSKGNSLFLWYETKKAMNGEGQTTPSVAENSQLSGTKEMTAVGP